MTYFISFIQIFFNILSLAVLARVLMSWIQGVGHHPLAVFLKDVTDPILNLAKKITPRIGMIDLSPVIALIGLDIIKAILIYALSTYLM